jgi:hypothetical protein
MFDIVNAPFYLTLLRITDKKEAPKAIASIITTNSNIIITSKLIINVCLNVLLETFYGVRCDFVYLSIRIFVDDVLSKKVKPSGMGRAQKSFGKPSKPRARQCASCQPTAQTSIPSSRSSPNSKTHCAKWHAEPSMHSGTQSELPSMTFPQKNASTIFAMPDMGPPNQDTL